MVVPFRDRTEAGWLLVTHLILYAHFIKVDEIICVENNS